MVVCGDVLLVSFSLGCGSSLVNDPVPFAIPSAISVHRKCHATSVIQHLCTYKHTVPTLMVVLVMIKVALAHVMINKSHTSLDSMAQDIPTHKYFLLIAFPFQTTDLK